MSADLASSAASGSVLDPVRQVAYDDRCDLRGGALLHGRPVEDHDGARPPRYRSAQRHDPHHLRPAARSPDRVHLRRQSQRRAGRPDLVRRHAIQHRLRPVWEVQTQITSEGWKAEYRIPFSQMRFSLEPAGKPSGASTSAATSSAPRRSIAGWRRLAASTGSCRGSANWFADAARAAAPARVSALRARPAGIHVRRRCRPRVVGRLGHADGARHVCHVVGDRESRFRAGRARPAVLNLSVFETFFPEKRPFFLEDSRTFVPPYFQFPTFHSRRIGQRPGRSRSRPATPSSSNRIRRRSSARPR